MKAGYMIALAGLASATPINKRQLGGFFGGGSSGGGLGGFLGGGGSGSGGSSTSNELEQGACREVTFIMARASTEAGNMGGSTGPATCSGLKSALGDDKVACQGVGGPYTAALADNALPRGSTPQAINEAKRLMTLAAQKCPQTSIVVGGYSQGTAVMHAAVSDLPADVKARVDGAVMYGDTRNQQDRGQIPNFPREKVKIFCEAGDGVCRGTLTVTAAHFAYADDVPAGVQFLQERLGAGSAGAAPAE
ncbi:hypothetical protein CAC42_7595 [Sphaceloma murrayae]|uniref:Cutinase n=1 Tax=Sphaceloma murrayae TaxID=2082308 RepID=A0A2K1QT17_9PEZI|nr:hypothetical protein CAC42_7595 [Sphaceloma murrayae]